jgi:anti-sigma regulatory factor (Ser/Thr protein kinase)
VIEMTAAYPLLTPTAGSGPARHARTFPGEPRHVAGARAFVAAALAGCPARETLLTCVSELAANAVVHTASGAGGMFTVEVIRLADGVAMVAVTDEGAPGHPAIRVSERFAESGRGLALVAACTSRWGYRAAGPSGGRTVWAEATWPVVVPDLPTLPPDNPPAPIR